MYKKILLNFIQLIFKFKLFIIKLKSKTFFAFYNTFVFIKQITTFILNEGSLNVMIKTKMQLIFSYCFVSCKSLILFLLRILRKLKACFTWVLIIILIISFLYLFLLASYYAQFKLLHPICFHYLEFLKHMIMLSLFIIFISFIFRLLKKSPLLRSFFELHKIMLPLLIVFVRIFLFLIKLSHSCISNKTDVLINFYGVFSVELLFSQTSTAFINFFLTTYRFKFNADEKVYRISEGFVNIKNDLISYIFSCNVVSSISSFFHSKLFLYSVILIGVVSLIVFCTYAWMIYDLAQAALHGEKLQQLITVISSYDWAVLRHNLYRCLRLRVIELIAAKNLPSRVDSALALGRVLSAQFTRKEIAFIVAGTSGAAFFLYDHDLVSILDKCIFAVQRQIYSFYVWRYGSNTAHLYFNADFLAKKNPLFPSKCTEAMYSYYLAGQLGDYVDHPIPTVVEYCDEVIYAFKTEKELDEFLVFRESFERTADVIGCSSSSFGNNNSSSFLNSDVPFVNLEGEISTTLSNSITSSPSSISTLNSHNLETVVHVEGVEVFCSVSDQSNIINRVTTLENASNSDTVFVSQTSNVPTPDSVGGSMLLYIGAFVVYGIAVFLIKHYGPF